jgi:hypothetical protein
LSIVSTCALPEQEARGGTLAGRTFVVSKLTDLARGVQPTLLVWSLRELLRLYAEQPAEVAPATARLVALELVHVLNAAGAFAESCDFIRSNKHAAMAVRLAVLRQAVRTLVAAHRRRVGQRSRRDDTARFLQAVERGRRVRRARAAKVSALISIQAVQRGRAARLASNEGSVPPAIDFWAQLTE